MPLVRIGMIHGKTAEYRSAVCDAIHRALVDAIKIPLQDRFQLLSEHRPEELIYDDSYLGISRSPDVLLIQITLRTGRSIEMKKALFARIAELLAKSPGVRKEDVFVSLIEVAKENWSFGNGVAQYASD